MRTSSNHSNHNKATKGAKAHNGSQAQGSRAKKSNGSYAKNWKIVLPVMALMGTGAYLITKKMRSVNTTDHMYDDELVN